MVPFMICYHTLTQFINTFFWYDYAIMVPSLPSDPIHFHVFGYDPYNYGIHMTKDMVLCTMYGMVPTLPSDPIHFHVF